MTFDLNDPALSGLHYDVDELPICCYLNSTAVMCEPQVYKLDFQKKQALLVSKTVLPQPERFDRFENVAHLPELKLQLRDLTEEEYAVTSDSYHNACNAIMGRGPELARILGAPLWLNDPLRIKCKRCDSCPLHLMTWGYSISLLNGAMFFGDFPLHFFPVPIM